jgi:arylsulfatase A-like enzyme
MLIRRLASVLLLALHLTCTLAAAAPAPERPNIIYIMADDLGHGDIGAFGQQRIHTPHLDRLAAEGTCFDHFYPGAAVCSPTRCVLMTGLHTGHARIRGNHGRTGVSRVPLEPGDVTVAEVLRSAGYATGIVGKWGLGEPGTTGIPNRKGFDHWFGYLNNDLAEDHFPERIWRNEQEIALPGNAGGKRGQYSAGLMTDEAIGFISSQRSRPFFLYLAYTLPHALLDVPDEDLAGYAGAFPEPEASRKNGRLITSQPRATFAAMVTRLDREVGRILDHLRATGLEQRTIVFFCSDNGAPDRGGVADFFRSNGPFRGHKGTLWEGGIRTPMIVRWPGRVPAGKRSDFPWAGWDFLPTAADLAGVPPPPGLDGISVLPALRGAPGGRAGHLYWETVEKDFAQAVRIGNLKAVRPGREAPLAVYDLRADPGETRDLAAEQPAFAARARELFRTARTGSEHWPVAGEATRPGRKQ